MCVASIEAMPIICFLIYANEQNTKIEIEVLVNCLKGLCTLKILFFVKSEHLFTRFDGTMKKKKCFLLI